jgi:signal peptidase II
MNKKSIAIVFILFLILLDQISKIYVKLNMHLGEHFYYLGNWASISFIENEGMAFGLSFGGGIGKLLLTFFRIIVVVFIAYYIKQQIQEGKANYLFVICLSLIFAGAVGNIIDSIFYGKIFSESTFNEVATIFPKEGYGTWFKGRVVDMFYFPIFRGNLPEFLPFVGGRYTEFFPYIFNLADAYITVGVFILLIFQNKIIK